MSSIFIVDWEGVIILSIQHVGIFLVLEVNWVTCFQQQTSRATQPVVADYIYMLELWYGAGSHACQASISAFRRNFIPSRYRSISIATHAVALSQCNISVWWNSLQHFVSVSCSIIGQLEHKSVRFSSNSSLFNILTAVLLLPVREVTDGISLWLSFLYFPHCVYNRRWLCFKC